MCYSSSVVPENLPINRFKRPEEWSEIVDLTREALDPELSYYEQVQANTAATEAITSIKDDEIFERVRYFALSKAVCFVMQVAMREECQSRIVEASADALCLRDQNLENPSEGLHIGGTEEVFNLAKAVTWVGWLVTEDKNYQSLDLAERIVMNGFGYSRIDLDRQVKQDGYSLTPKRSPADDAISGVVEVLMSGAALTMKEVLATIYEEQFGEHAIIYTPIKKFITPEQIEKLDLVKAGIGAASLRLDEVDYVHEFLKLKHEWAVEFDGSVRREEDRPRELHDEDRQRLKICHEARIGCPALYVKDALRFVLVLMPQIVSRAQRHLLAQT